MVLNEYSKYVLIDIISKVTDDPVSPRLMNADWDSVVAVAAAAVWKNVQCPGSGRRSAFCSTGGRQSPDYLSHPLHLKSPGIDKCDICCLKHLVEEGGLEKYAVPE